MARRKRRRLPRPLLGVLFAVVLLGTVEAGFRAAGVREAYRPEELGQWRFAANLHHKSFRGPRDGHDFVVTSNQDGLRTGISVERTPGITRVAFMGDSTVFGWGVNDGEAVADAVQRAVDPTRVEVLNAGQPGYSTTMAAWLFDEVLVNYTPDLTVVFVPMHDSNQVLVSDAELLHGGASAVAKVRVWLARDSRTYQVLRTLVFNATDRAFLLNNETGDEPRVARVSDAERSAAIDGMVAKAAAFNGKIALGYLPFLADIELDRPTERPTEAWMREYAETHGLQVLDPRACCRGGENLVLPDDPGHLSAAGNALAGATVATLLTAALTSP